MTQGARSTAPTSPRADVLFFHATSRRPEHEGLHRDGKFIEAPHTGASVRVSDLTGRSDNVTARRIIPEWAPSLHQVASAIATEIPNAIDPERHGGDRDPERDSRLVGRRDAAAVIRDYAPKVGLDPAAVIAYALTQGGTSWGAGDTATTAPRASARSRCTSAARRRAAGPRGRAWANSPQGLIDGMNMMAHAGATGKSGPEAAAFIVGPSFGRGANPARTWRRRAPPTRRQRRC